jgi:capsular polysaccharide biosynthesis protein
MCKVSQLLVPQIESFSGFIHPVYPQILRNAYAHVVEGATPGINRIYISRRVAPGRHMRHEAELESALITLGFKILFLEKMTVEEQMRAFASAYMIVGPHGAGLSHIHFSQAGAYVLEFFPDSYFNDCYARLAVGLGHTYDHLTCKYDAEWEGGMLPIDNILSRVKERIQVMEPANNER